MEGVNNRYGRDNIEVARRAGDYWWLPGYFFEGSIMAVSNGRMDYAWLEN